jgi:hypothetical protein
MRHSEKMMKTTFRNIGQVVGVLAITLSLLLGNRYQSVGPPSNNEADKIIRKAKAAIVPTEEQQVGIDPSLLSELLLLAAQSRSEYQSAMAREDLYAGMLIVCGIFLLLPLNRNDSSGKDAQPRR